MLPVGFEPTAFHLGGERSILLSYGSLAIWDLRFAIFDLRKAQIAIQIANRDRIVKKQRIACQIANCNLKISRIVTYQRLHIMALKFLTALEEIEFDDEQQARDLSTNAFNEINYCPCGAAGCEQIVNY